MLVDKSHEFSQPLDLMTKEQSTTKSVLISWDILHITGYLDRVCTTEAYMYGSVYPPLVNAILSRSRENYRAIRDNYRVIRDD